MADKNKNLETNKSIQEAFYLADIDNKGFLNRFDLKVAMVSLFGYKPSSFEIHEIISKSGTSKGPGLTLDLFQQIAISKINAEDRDDHIRQIFRACDIECRGFLTLENAKQLFSQAAPFMDTPTVERIFREMDGDRDGRISYKDFEFIMKYVVDDE